MKKSKTFKTPQLFLFLAACLGYAAAAPYGPAGRTAHWTQPGGNVLELKTFGDEYYGRTETTDGYTVIYDSTDGAYHYAGLSADGTKLLPSGPVVNGVAPEGLAKHLDLQNEVIGAARDAKSAVLDVERQARWTKRLAARETLRTGANGDKGRLAAAKIQAAPVTGNKVGLTILVKFPNDPRGSGNDGEKFPTTKEKITRFCNTEGYQEDGNTGSVRDYFFDQSGGQLTYTQSVTNIITMPKPKNYYNFSDYPANRVFRGDASRVLVADAIAVLKSKNFDFSTLTVNSDKIVEATNLFFAGEDSGVWAQGLWPQQWSLPSPLNVGTTANPRYIFAYQMTNIPDAFPVIGTFCHENGHLILDYPDLYAQTGEGVGEHCLMGSGNYLNDGKTPSPINAHLKDVVGWANITEITPAQSVIASLPSTGNQAYRIRKPGSPTESFVFENRGTGDRWAEFSDDKGVAIWHIDEKIDGNLRGGAHYGIALEQADGAFDLENGVNRGDDTDLFDSTDADFNDKTGPDSRWWDGSNSFIKAKVLSIPGSNMEVSFAGVAANTIIVDSPNGNEIFYPGAPTVIRWRANITGNLKVELYKGGKFFKVLSASEKNDGGFNWTVPETLAVATDYAIRLSSLTNTVAVSDTSDGTFQITESTFPPDNKLPPGWFKPKGTQSTWKVVKSPVYEGDRALASGKITDGKTSAIGYRSKFREGRVTFYLKASTERDFDFARFYIDGVAQVLDGKKTGLSGATDWMFYSFSLPAGNHTLIWTYEKDDSYAQRQDTVWLDAVTLPETTQEIAVEVNGENIQSDKETLVFPQVTMGNESKAKTITIRNKGTSHLYGIKVVKLGNEPDTFNVTKLKTDVLAPGESTSVKLTFAPNRRGNCSATIQIKSNDPDESRFNIGVKGKALGIPQIAVYQPTDKKLKDEGSRNFGVAKVGSIGASKVFTVTNVGSEPLTGLALSINGTNKSDFKRGTLGKTTLAPGETTTFTVVFQPTAKDVRTAQLHIASNDPATAMFDITLTGKGAPKSKSGKSSPLDIVAATLGKSASILSSPASVYTASGVDVVDGSKYLSLSVAKEPGVSATVEVSSNLLDWFSGPKHTTVIVDDATTLKVRDNTPVTRDAKRFIRLK